MANKIYYFIKGLVNIELVYALFLMLLYFLFRKTNYQFFFDNLPKEALISPIGVSSYALYKSWEYSFKFFTVLGTSNVEVKSTSALENINVLLWGSLFFQAIVYIFGLYSVVALYNKEIFFGSFSILSTSLILILCCLSLRRNLGKFHGLLRLHGVQIDNLQD